MTSASVQGRLCELEKELDTVKAQLSIVRTKLRDSKPERIDVDEAQKLFRDLAQIFPECDEDEKEKLVDAVLKRAVVDKEKSVEFEFYAGDGMGDVVQYVKNGSPNRIHGQHRSARTVRVRADSLG